MTADNEFSDNLSAIGRMPLTAVNKNPLMEKLVNSTLYKLGEYKSYKQNIGTNKYRKKPDLTSPMSSGGVQIDLKMMPYMHDPVQIPTMNVSKETTLDEKQRTGPIKIKAPDQMPDFNVVNKLKQKEKNRLRRNQNLSAQKSGKLNMNEKNLRQEVDKLVLKYMEKKETYLEKKAARSTQPMKRFNENGIDRDRNVD
jgi:hypothetical protein